MLFWRQRPGDRGELIEKAIYEFIELFKVSEEAQSAQKETHEQQAYRESAIKKQIDFLQNQLDEMHLKISPMSEDLRTN